MDTNTQLTGLTRPQQQRCRDLETALRYAGFAMHRAYDGPFRPAWMLSVPHPTEHAVAVPLGTGWDGALIQFDPALAAHILAGVGTAAGIVGRYCRLVEDRQVTR